MKKRTGFDTMSPYLYPFYICRHPRDGFLELKANKKGSPTVVLITVALWLFVELFYRVATGFDMNGFSAEETSLLRTGVVTVAMFVMVCLSNWCICTLMEGKGKLMDICVVGANALVPYIFVRFLTTMLSWVFAGDEQVVHREGQTFVVVEEGFLDTVYDYYPYHSPIFRGRERVQRSYERPAITDE